MDEKPVAGLVTFLIAAPAMLLCCLAPFVLASSISGFLAWLTGGSVLLGGMIAVLAGAFVYLIYRQRCRSVDNGKKTDQADVAKMSSQPPFRKSS